LDPRYRPLKVGGKSWFGRASYWLGNDHLLLVNVEQFSENYRRFYHRDVLAVIIRRTRRWELELALGAALFLLLAVPALAFGANPATSPAGWTFGVLALLVLLGVVIHGWRGPTCQVDIQTRVQRRSLPSVGRVKMANRLMAVLHPKILEAQTASVTKADSIG